jgi:hypothetical protein
MLINPQPFLEQLTSAIPNTTPFAMGRKRCSNYCWGVENEIEHYDPDFAIIHKVLSKTRESIT